MKVLVVAREIGRAVARRSALEQLGGRGCSVSCRQGEPASIGEAVAEDRPDLVLLDGVCSTPDDLRQLDAVTRDNPEVAFVIVGATSTPEFLRSAMAVGIREVVDDAADDRAIEEAFGRAAARLPRAASASKATVVVALPCKGGSGATFLATNVAYMLAAEYGKKTALVDVDLSVGDAAYLVSERPGPTSIADVARNAARLDAAMLDASVQHILPNFDVLAAPDSLESGMEVTAERVEQILALVEAHYEFVIVNVGRNIDSIAVRAIDRADWLLPVLQLSVPAIRDTRRILATLDTLGVESKRIHLVANRVDKHCEISVGDAERTVGRPIELVVPNDFAAVSRSENQGVPLAKFDGRSGVVGALRGLIEMMPGCTPRGRVSWFSGLFGSG